MSWLCLPREARSNRATSAHYAVKACTGNVTMKRVLDKSPGLKRKDVHNAIDYLSRVGRLQRIARGVYQWI